MRLRPNLEQLEDRTLPSNYTASTVADLINDISAANKAGGTNTITLAANTTFDLTAVNDTTDGPTGLPVIKKGDSLTITGQGSDVIQRDTAASAFRLFDVASGATLTLSNLMLQNGLAYGSGSAADGGAIYNQGSLTLNGVTVQNNTAQGANGISATTDTGNGTNGYDGAGGGIWSSIRFPPTRPWAPLSLPAAACTWPGARPRSTTAASLTTRPRAPSKFPSPGRLPAGACTRPKAP
jgi:hypothetical protein